MSNLKTQIPQFAYINAQVLQDLLPSVQDEIDRIATQRYPSLGGSYDILNPAYVVSLLYCILVVPHEVWLKKPEENVIQMALGGFSPEKYFVLRDVSPTDRNAYHFLRRLRNAIAHARFTIEDDWTFEFEDQKSGQPVDFRVTTSVKELLRFLTDVGARLANLRSLLG
jgi:hypothetical protein